MEWRLLISARRLIMVYICTKFREIISNGIKVMDRTRMFNRWQTDGRTDGWTDGRTDTKKFRGYNIIHRHFLWRGIIRTYIPWIFENFPDLWVWYSPTNYTRKSYWTPNAPALYERSALFKAWRITIQAMFTERILASSWISAAGQNTFNKHT